MVARDPNREIARRSAAMRRREALGPSAVENLKQRTEILAFSVTDPSELAVMAIKVLGDRIALSTNWQSIARRLTETASSIDERIDLAVGPNGEAFATMNRIRRSTEADQAVLTLLGRLNAVLADDSVDGVVVGYAFLDSDNPTVNDTFEAAQLAAAVATSSRPAVAFDPNLRHQQQQTSALDRSIVLALLEDGVRLQYQPIMNMATGDVDGLEALARLSVGGVDLQPRAFLPVLSRKSLLPTLGNRVVETIKHDLQVWKETAPFSPAAIWVNLSIEEVRAGNTSGLISALESLPVPSVGVELKERVVSSTDRVTRRAMAELGSAGLSLAVDDFTIMRMPVGQLASLQLDQVKINQRQGADQPGLDSEFVPALVDLLHKLGISVVATGVENEHSLSVAQAIKADAAQGFLLSRPLSSNDVSALQHSS